MPPLDSRRAYDLHQLWNLDGIPNVDAVIERIDLSARAATVFMRQHGMNLPGETSSAGPTLDAVDRHLRKLVSEAFESFQQAVGDNPTDEVDGVAGDDLFDVWIESAGNVTGHLMPPLHIRIAMWLC